MNTIQKQIIKQANVKPQVLDSSYKTLPSIKKDITRRLKSQKKAYDRNENNPRCLETQPHVRSIIGDSVKDLQSVLDVVNKMS